MGKSFPREPLRKPRDGQNAFGNVPRESRNGEKERLGVRGYSRKSLGKCFGVCGTPASLSANALAFAGTPASLAANALAFAGLPRGISKSTLVVTALYPMHSSGIRSLILPSNSRRNKCPTASLSVKTGARLYVLLESCSQLVVGEEEQYRFAVWRDAVRLGGEECGDHLLHFLRREWAAGADGSRSGQRER